MHGVATESDLVTDFTFSQDGAALHQAVLEVVQERSRVTPAIRGRVPPLPKTFNLFLI